MSNLFEYLNKLIEENRDPNDLADEILERYGQTVAVLVLDSTGFSRVSEKLGILHSLSLLMLMRKFVKPVIEVEHPRLLKFEADNAFAVFSHPDEALRAAFAAHKVVREQGLMLTPEEKFQVCIGIGYGPMLYSETLEGYFGHEMNLASKLGEDTAESGETLITSAVHKVANPTLLEGFEPRELHISGIKTTYYRHYFD